MYAIRSYYDPYKALQTTLKAEINHEAWETLQTGKRNVILQQVEPVGNYALKLVFSDGHDSGLYSWDYLAEIGASQDALWQDYLDRLDAAGASRDIDTTPGRNNFV